MKSRRNFAVLLSLLLVPACSGESSDAAAAGGEAMAPADDEAALAALGDYYETHYNMHHASMVADVFQEEESGFLAADGAVLMGRAAILANLETEMQGSPTLDLVSSEFMLFGDVAVGRGEYSVETTPPGAETMTMSGNWLATYNRQADGNWKLGWVTSNMSHAWPEGMMAAAAPAEPMEETGTMSALIGGYMTHYNLGHPSMVADLYTEDAITGRAGNPWVSGREAISAALATSMEGNPGGHLTIHDVGTQEIAEGWAVDGGYYTVSAGEGGDVLNVGNYMALVRQDADGSWKLHWSVNNGWPAAAIPPAM